jgi:hypothetical protein
MRWQLALFGLIGANSLAHSQQSPPLKSNPEPKPLPAAIANAPIAPAINFVRFDPADLALKRVEGRWQLSAGKTFLKDFGPLEREANEALRVVRDLNFTQYGTIAGSTPPFEFWLQDAEGVRGGLVVKNVVPFNNKAIATTQIAGAWVIHDDSQMLYNFGTQKEAAQQALEIIKKFGFNQLGLVGIPNPAMTYLCVDPYAKSTGPKTPDLKAMVGKISEQGLVLPNLGFVGGRIAIEPRKLELIRAQNEWALVHGKDVLARFGNDSIKAREALRLMQDSRVSELCLVGNIGLPIFLSRGQAPHSAGLGFNNARLQPSRMKAQKIGNAWCITNDGNVLVEFGDNREDAELVLKVLLHFQFDQFCPIGDLNHGGFRLFTRSR